jgi:hypothetical protein
MVKGRLIEINAAHALWAFSNILQMSIYSLS